jgi:AmiR/NasT family two-component response regulator
MTTTEAKPTLTEHSPANWASVKLPAQPARLLVADDEHLVAAGLSTSLIELGYAVTGLASDGEAAVEMCRVKRPDMALLDIRMPKQDGLSAAEIIFKQMGVPTIALSAYSDQEYITAANRVGVFAYLLKPITQDQLRVTISVAWARYVDHAIQQSEITNLKQRLEDRKIIEQAKWVIVSRKGVSEPEAMRMLQLQARSTRRTLVDVSRSVLENDNLFKTL